MGRCRGPNVELPPRHERDLRDDEVDELRRQVQQLQQSLERHEPFDHNGSHHNSDGLLEEIMKREILLEIRSTNLEVKHFLMSLFLIDVLHGIMVFNGIN